MNMKKLRIATVALTLILLIAASGCQQEPEPAASGTTPSPAALVVSPGETDAPPAPEVGESALPLTKDISITREGETETFAGTLAQSDNGYAIYILPDFAFIPGDAYDAVQPKQDAQISGRINMRIYKAPGDSAQPDDSETDGAVTRYERVQLDETVFEVEFNYPTEAAEGGAIMLKAMLDTISSS
jgi:hypothetical protein